MSKQTKSYRISKLTIQQLEQLAEKWGMSLTETLTLIIDRAYQQANTEHHKGHSVKSNNFIKS